MSDREEQEKRDKINKLREVNAMLEEIIEKKRENIDRLRQMCYSLAQENGVNIEALMAESSEAEDESELEESSEDERELEDDLASKSDELASDEKKEEEKK